MIYLGVDRYATAMLKLILRLSLYQLMVATQLWAQCTVKFLALALPSDKREPQPYGWGQLSPQIHWVYERAQNQIRTNLT